MNTNGWIAIVVLVGLCGGFAGFQIGQSQVQHPIVNVPSNWDPAMEQHAKDMDRMTKENRDCWKQVGQLLAERGEEKRCGKGKE